MKYIYKIIFYLSYLVLLFFWYFIYHIYKFSYENNYVIYFFTIITMIFIYARFIEPKIILIKKTEIKVGFKANIVILSDLHLGIFKDHKFLKKIVKKVNKIENIDFVLVPWDSIFYAEKNDLEKLFHPLFKIDKPIFVTFGAHDLESQYITKADLIAVFSKYNLIVLDNKSIKLDNWNLIILGLWDSQINDDNVKLINDFSQNDNLLVIAHNPDTNLKYKNSDIPKITISGHTHWWQIRLPFIYKYIIPCKWKFDQWFYEYNWNRLFVSSGLWEVLLSMRFLIPPVIDVLKLR